MKPSQCTRPAGHSSPRREQGVALIVALILLVVMTLLALSALRTGMLEEKMTAQTFDRSLSFQATEAALRQAEGIAETNKPTPAALSGCTNGVCGLGAMTDQERWLDSSFSGWATATAVVSGPIAITPQYIIEYLGNTYPCQPGTPALGSTCKRYRITARSNTGADRAAVMLQSIYGTE